MKGSKSAFWIWAFIIVLILSVLILTITFLRSEHTGSNNVYVPFGFIAIFISFYLFNENNRIRKAKRHNRQEEMNRRRQELLDQIVKKNKEQKSGD